MEIIKQITNEFKTIDSIRAIALGGSTASRYDDDISDYDIYIYTDCEIDNQIRTQIAKKFAQEYEIDNRFFETGDEWRLKDSDKGIDIMYRSPDWIEEQINRIWKECGASVGYSTCFIYNVKNSIILYDKNDWYKNLQESISGSYPDKLKKNITAKNLPLIYGKMSATFTEQITNAVKRDDLVSVNHRISAFLASYFDIIFAINKQLHPGEKRLVRFAKGNCKILPKNFEENINELITTSKENKAQVLQKITEELKKLISKI